MQAIDNQYPYLEYLSKRWGMTPEKMLEVYRVERVFHDAILREGDFEKRQRLYEQVYTEVDRIVDADPAAYFKSRIPIKSRIARHYRRELEGRSVLDVGCGDGTFLYALAKSGIPVKTLYGLDIKAPAFDRDDPDAARIQCYQRNVIRFEVPQQFDTIILDNVYEHIAPQDQPFLIESLKRALKPDGTVILIAPHRNFGPNDSTMIFDHTYSGKVAARCVHLNETSFRAVMDDLSAFGFDRFRSTVPFIAFQRLRDWFPGLRVPASWYAAIENSLLLRLLKRVRYKGRCLFRMEVVVIARSSNNTERQ
jgi:SAM-dependent methyltransferase